QTDDIRSNIQKTCKSKSPSKSKTSKETNDVRTPKSTKRNLTKITCDSPSRIPCRISGTPTLNNRGSLDNTELAATLAQMFKSIQQIDKNYCSIIRADHTTQEISDKLKNVEDCITRQSKEIQKINKLLENKIRTDGSNKATEHYISTGKTGDKTGNKEDMVKLMSKIEKIESCVAAIEKTIYINNKALTSISTSQELTKSSIQKQKDAFSKLLLDSKFIQQQLEKKEEEIEILRLENGKLKQKITDLQPNLQDFQSPNPFHVLSMENTSTNQVASEDNKSKSFQSVKYRKNYGTRTIQTLIVGDSMLKNIDPRRMYKQTFIKTLRGRKIADIDAYIQNYAVEDIQNIVIHAGTNNISDGCTIESCIKDYTTMVDNIKQKYPSTKICISSITQRSDTTTNKTIDILNNKLKNISRDNISYIDNSNIKPDIHLMDSVHLNDQGTAAIVKNMKDVIGPLIGVKRIERKNNKYRSNNYQSKQQTNNGYMYPPYGNLFPFNLMSFHGQHFQPNWSQMYGQRPQLKK
uniref:Uncharacterized protein LOC102805076 n=1 Tax=Saccoglossus kowalevskii TaxID=10224 RepID=A0ABM0M3A0_SACKO